MSRIAQGSRPMMPAVDGVTGRNLSDRYEIDVLVGEGGMAQTYRGWDRSGAQVAIKILRTELGEMSDRFHTEGRLAAMLSHPNIVTVLDQGQTDDGIHYIVMELLRGRTLNEVIAREHPVAMPRVQRMMRQLLAALEAAHARGIIHADVKSDNLIVENASDGRELVKLVDFGLARLPSASEPEVGLVSGTPEYLAPEIIDGGAPTVASDLYAAGIVLYELLAGVPPFTGATPQEVITRQLHDDVVPPSLRSSDRYIPQAIDAVIARALDKNPTRRFASAAQFAEALAPLVGATSSVVTHHRRSRIDGGGPLAAATTTHNWRVPTQPPVVQEPRNDLRDRLAEALRGGDLDGAAALYLDAAVRKVREHDVDGALTEIREALHVLTSGAGPNADVGPGSLWRLLYLGARLCDAAGRPDEARETAKQGLRRAARAGVPVESKPWLVMERLARYTSS